MLRATCVLPEFWPIDDTRGSGARLTNDRLAEGGDIPFNINSPNSGKLSNNPALPFESRQCGALDKATR